MWPRLRILLVILSFSLNAAFLGVWGMKSISAAPAAKQVKGCAADSACKVWCPLHRALGTTDEQWQTLAPKQQAFLDQSQSLCRDVRTHRAELIALIAAHESPRDSIRLVQEQIVTAQRRMQDLIIDHLLSEKQLLTAQQRELLFSMLNENRSCGASAATAASHNCRPEHNSKSE